MTVARIVGIAGIAFSNEWIVEIIEFFLKCPNVVQS